MAQSDPHQSKWRDPPVQLSRNVGGQDLPARLCDRLELFKALNWLAASLSIDWTYPHFALRSSRTYIYLITTIENWYSQKQTNTVTRTVSFIQRGIFHVVAFKYDPTCSHLPNARHRRRRLQVRSCVHKANTRNLHSMTDTKHIHGSSSWLPQGLFNLDSLGKGCFRAFCPNNGADRGRGVVIYKSRSNRVLSNNEGLPFVVEIVWGYTKSLADASAYGRRVIMNGLTKRCTDAHCWIKDSSHPGVDPNCSHSPLDSAVVVELEAIDGINALNSRPREVT